MRGAPGHESATDLTGGIQLTAGERACAGDRVARPVIGRRLRLEQGQNPSAQSAAQAATSRRSSRLSVCEEGTPAPCHITAQSPSRAA
ncbi:hypothetical protein [Herbiconiux sp. UC225_62]|uniref:hypothetical protein n=1 Tax=Herbiconiux sp. UC225_62 TaxID=3350168 RepID=UPI0036D335BF